MTVSDTTHFKNYKIIALEKAMAIKLYRRFAVAISLLCLMVPVSE